MSIRSKNILSMEDLALDEIELILKTAKSFSSVSDRVIKKVPTLRGRTIINLFFEPSTRTRTSFEIAGKRLSADVINISEKSSATVKGESLKDTALTLQAMQTDAIVIRHSRAGSAGFLSSYVNARVINAGDGCHEHPTQALLDLYTLKENFVMLKDKKVVIVGDIIHSRVARSDIIAFGKMGAEVTLVAPPTLIPRKVENMVKSVSSDLRTEIRDADLVYLLRMQSERQDGCFVPTLREYSQFFGINADVLKLAPAHLKVMHPGPINRGVEISSEVADMEDVLILNQVTSGIHVRMALLFLLLSGEEEAEEEEL